MARKQIYTPKIKPHIKPDELYSSGMLVDLYANGRELPSWDRLKVRSCMNALKYNRDFPKEGDGFVKHRNTETKAWKGQRWLDAMT